jgi:sugar fermentation stimulation protein A
MESLFPGALALPDLFRGRLIKRYKRFLADVKRDTGEMVTAHCPNPGRMLECSEPGRPVYLSHHDNPKRKLKYTWEIIDMPGTLVGVNTLNPNRLVHRSIYAGLIPALAEYSHIQPEVRVGEHSRIDLLLSSPRLGRCYVEIKNCSLVSDGIAMFPDAVTIRGRKHLMELERLMVDGHRCAVFFLIQRMDAKVFKPADHIDPAYGKALREAEKNGLEIIVYDVSISLQRIRLRNSIPWQLDALSTG